VKSRNLQQYKYICVFPKAGLSCSQSPNRSSESNGFWLPRLTQSVYQPPTMSSEPVELFYSYSHKDEKLRDELAVHLSLLQRQGVISAWHDRNISAGSEWAKEIDQNLNSAQIILLLVSANFLASDYCYSIEMQRAIERHEAGEACVIPIILRPVEWSGAPFGKLQALPKNARPVTTWKEKAFVNIVQGIRKAAEEIRERSPLPTAIASPALVPPIKPLLPPRHKIRQAKSM
jgi:hypothetical protein